MGLDFLLLGKMLHLLQIVLISFKSRSYNPVLRKNYCPLHVNDYEKSINFRSSGSGILIRGDSELLVLKHLDSICLQ